MKTKSNDQRKRLTWNIALMIFTLFTLGCCILAWFSASDTAHINELQLRVERMELNPPQTTLIEFPCATKIAEISGDMFNTYAVCKDYVINGEGQLTVSVDCQGDGMLAYVCTSSSSTDYYSLIINDLITVLGNDRTTWTYDAIEEALVKINKRAVGNTVDGNTVIRIVYWVEYDPITQNTAYISDAYWDSGDSYFAKITFTA